MTTSTMEVRDAIVDALKAVPAIMAIVAGIYDRPPKVPFGAAGRTAYVSLGATDTAEDDADCISGLETTVQVDTWSRAPGRREGTELTDLVRRALHRQPITIAGSAICDAWVVLTRILDDPDGLTTHGVIQVTLRVEEA